MMSALRSSLLELLQEGMPEWASIEEATPADLKTHPDQLCTAMYKDSIDGGQSFVRGWLATIDLCRETDEVTGLRVCGRLSGIYKGVYFPLADQDVIEQTWERLTNLYKNLVS